MSPTTDRSFAGPLMEAIESAAPLDRIATPVTNALRRLLSPGSVKDAISGTWLGHPLHPMLTDVVVGALLSTSALDLVAGDDQDPARERLVAIGVAAYLPTAATGASDWLDATSDSRVKRAGLVHAVANLIGVGLYAGSLRPTRRGAGGRAIALRGMGAMALGAGAYLGGHLSFRRNVGPDQTAFDPGSSDWTFAVERSELAEGRPQRAIAGETPVLLLRDGERVRAIHDRCSHRGCSLSDGEVEGDEVVCGCHFSRFSLVDGSVRRGPAVAPQPAFDARVVEGRVEVRRRGG